MKKTKFWGWLNVAIINVLPENSYNFISNNVGLYVSENNYEKITLQEN